MFQTKYTKKKNKLNKSSPSLFLDWKGQKILLNFNLKFKKNRHNLFIKIK